MNPDQSSLAKYGRRFSREQSADIRCAVAAVMMVFSLPAAALQLRYDEAAENVTIVTAQGSRVYHYQEQQNGFVSPQGDWVGWNTSSESWESIPRKGVREWYNLQGTLIAREKPAKQPATKSGYDPREDVSDSGSASGDVSGASEYLQQRSAVSTDARPLVGEEYGSPIVEEGSIGGSVAAKQKAERADWASRSGAHAGDPEAAMDTGEVPDPLKKLADTVNQIQSAVQGVNSTIQEVNSLDDQIENFGEDDYIPDPMPRVEDASADEENDENRDDPSPQAISSRAARPMPLGSSMPDNAMSNEDDMSGISASPSKQAGGAYGKPPPGNQPGSLDSLSPGNSMAGDQE